MLFIHHRQSQTVKLDVLLDEGVRADDDVHLPVLDQLAQPPSGRRVKVSGEQRHGHGTRQNTGVAADPSLFRDNLTGPARSWLMVAEVLLGEDFGGRHEGPLTAVGSRHQEGRGGDYSLAAADVPLEQPRHRPGFRQVSQYFPQGLFLRRCEAERQAPDETVQHGAIRHERRPGLSFLPVTLLAQDAYLEEEQFVEGESDPRPVLERHVVWEVGLGDRQREVQQSLSCPRFGRDEIGHHRRPLVHDRLQELPRLARPEALGEVVYRDQASGVKGLALFNFPFRRLEYVLSAEQRDAPADDDARVGLEAFGDIRVVEPYDADIACFISDDGLGAPSVAHVQHSSLPDIGDNRLFPALGELRNGFPLAEIEMAAREEIEQVPERIQAESLESGRGAGVDALQDGDGRFK